MRENLIKSYPNLKCPIKAIPLPPINIKEERVENTIENYIKLIYPASYYRHKNHDFLFDLSEIYKTLKFEIWVTLKKKEFKKYARLPYVKNLGIISHTEVIEKYKISNGLVNFSNTESFCLPLVEAIYLNLPILTINRDYSEWMCEESAYYFEDYVSFEKSLKQLIEDISNNIQKSLEKPKEKFRFSWIEIGNKINSYFQL
jgi:hypothetical protein